MEKLTEKMSKKKKHGVDNQAMNTDLYSFYLFRKSRIEYFCDVCGKKIRSGEYYYLKKFTNKTYKGRPICLDCGRKMRIKPEKHKVEVWNR